MTAGDRKLKKNFRCRIYEVDFETIIKMCENTVAHLKRENDRNVLNDFVTSQVNFVNRK